jgi:2OG-Fe(II) oxygenase superfamily
MIQIVDDVIPQNWLDDMMSMMREVAWVWQKGTSYKTTTGNFIQGLDVFTDENTIDTHQFVHYAMLNENRSFMYSYSRPLVLMLENKFKIKIKNMIRMKFNHLAPQPNFGPDNYNIAHSDNGNEGSWSVIFYLNDSDGDTFFFEETYHPTDLIKTLTLQQRVSPKAGRAVLFPSVQMHASANPINTPNRFVLNLAFEIEK